MYTPAHTFTTSATRAMAAVAVSTLLGAGSVTAASAAPARPSVPDASVTAATAPLVHPSAGSSTRASERRCADERRIPRVVERWEAAWNSGDPHQLSRLFTADARYTDHAFGATFTGREGVRQWAEITARSVGDARIDVESATRRGRSVEIHWTFSGQLVGAPDAFSVPARTVLHLRGNRIASNDDYYELAEVLRQSGLPADTTFG